VNNSENFYNDSKVDERRCLMYKYWVIAITLLGCTIFISHSIYAAFQGVNPLKDVKKYKIYYGPANVEIIDRLGNYDLAIIEPHEFTEQQVSSLKESKTLSLGYMSIMELEKWNKEFVDKVIESDYYYTNNEKIYIERWDTYIMDISQPHFRQILLEEIQEEIIAKGFDGIFLDTVGDIDDYFLKKPKELKKLRTGYINLLKEIKKQNKDIVLIQNWGFDTYKNASKPFIDGILWENFSKSGNQYDKWSQNWIKYFNEEKRKSQLAIFTVSPDDPSKSYSEKIGFVPYKNENSIYNDWFD
jgi:polysaccharide biosynthesis protein PelA